MYVALSSLSCVTNKETEAQTGQITGLESGAGQEQSRPEGLSGSLSPLTPPGALPPCSTCRLSKLLSHLCFSPGVSASVLPLPSCPHHSFLGGKEVYSTSSFLFFVRFSFSFIKTWDRWVRPVAWESSRERWMFTLSLMGGP